MAKLEYSYYHNEEQLFHIDYFIKNGLILKAVTVEMEKDFIEETENFYYSSKGYYVLEMYKNINKVLASNIKPTLIQSAQKFLLLNEGRCDFDEYRDIMFKTNKRLLTLKNVGVSNDTLEWIIDLAYDEYSNDKININDLLTKKYFMIKEGRRLTLDQMRSEIITFFNKRKTDTMNENMAKIEVYIYEVIDKGEDFLSYDKIASEFGLKENTVKKYCQDLKVIELIKEYNIKNFHTHRKDNLKTHEDIRGAGYDIHYNEDDFITQSKVSDKTDRALITVAKNWKPHKDEFKKLNDKLKNR